MPRFATIEIYERWLVKTALLQTWKEKYPDPAKRDAETAAYIFTLEKEVENMHDRRGPRKKLKE